MHQPSISLREALDALASTPTPANFSDWCRQTLGSGDRPVVVIACGGRNDRADGYPAACWRAGFAVVNVDTCNDELHTLLDHFVEHGLALACASGIVVCFSAQQPCGAFSVLRFKRVAGQPEKWPILVNKAEPDGRVEMKNHPKHGRFLKLVWRLLEVVDRLFRLVDAKGGLCWVENPPSYGHGASYVPGFEEHSSVFDTTLFITLADDTSSELLQHDQCSEAGENHGVMKRTAALVNRLYIQACQRFTRFCPHPPGTHRQTVGAGPGAVLGDASASRKWSAYSRGYARAWVECTPRELGKPMAVTAALAAQTGCNIPVSLSDGISGSGPRAIQHASANTGLHGCGRGACTLAATTSTSVTLDPTLESRANAASTPGRCGVTSPVHVPLIRSNAIDIDLNKPVQTRACTAAAGMRSL